MVLKNCLKYFAKLFFKKKIDLSFKNLSCFFLVGLLTTNIYFYSEGSYYTPLKKIFHKDIEIQKNEDFIKEIINNFIVDLEKNQENKLAEAIYNERSKTENMIKEIINNFNTGLKKDQENKLAEIIYKESIRYGHDPLLIVAIISTESSFNNWAKSKKGAKGLMQILPVTAQEIAKETNINWKNDNALYNPFINIRMGSYYLSKLNLIFEDIDLALEAYNRGPSKISHMMKKGKIFHKRYSRKVLSFYTTLKEGDYKET
ncbi:MAG TPA: lytic transglycosylase domain-containing protein [Nitrospinota bacterium]|nr:lytic transglycosylase domain-containing protein [Nitrospinota bacterium]